MPGAEGCPGLARSEVSAGAAAAVPHRREAAVGAGPGRRGTRPALRALRVPQPAAPAPALPGPAAGEHSPTGHPTAGHCRAQSPLPERPLEQHLAPRASCTKKVLEQLRFCSLRLSPVGFLALCSKCNIHFPALVSDTHGQT